MKTPKLKLYTPFFAIAKKHTPQFQLILKTPQLGKTLLNFIEQEDTSCRHV
jgi:hypothetical protein